jgi:hypothetical protein
VALLGQALELEAVKAAVRPFLGRAHITRERLGRAAKGPSDPRGIVLLCPC